MNDTFVVLSACATAEEAERIAAAAVELHLAACVQILPQMRSVYRWQGKVESAAEHLLLFKTTAAKFELLRSKIEELHSYEVPEILALPAAAGSEKYLAWLKDAVNA